MYSFRDDYSECACPEVIKAITEKAYEQNISYGEDKYCEKAAHSILALAKREGTVAFLAGGTQTNLIAIASVLRPYQSAIAATTGHINVHETGSVEATGHKVCTVPAENGKLTPELVDKVVKEHSGEHMVAPKLVYISNSTELGTVYTKAELTALRKYCDEHNLYLYLDGARLGAALTCNENDMTMADIAALTDAFYIGGTKNGALFGEALVIFNPDMAKDFRFMMKQRGALTAKGYILGIQFDALFNDGENSCWFKYARHENEAAETIAKAIKEAGYGFYVPPVTNQLFPIMPKEKADKLMEEFPYHPEKTLPNGDIVVRLVTSWSITEEAVKDICKWFEDNKI